MVPAAGEFGEGRKGDLGPCERGSEFKPGRSQMKPRCGWCRPPVSLAKGAREIWSPTNAATNLSPAEVDETALRMEQAAGEFGERRKGDLEPYERGSEFKPGRSR
jgi:hypothetical protein